MLSDSDSLVATLLAAGATPDVCWDSLLGEGFPPPNVFRAFHEIRKDSCATVLLASRLVSEAWEAKDFTTVSWLSDALHTCGIHPYSVECLTREVEDHGWWRDHATLSSDINLPSQSVEDVHSHPLSFVGVDFRNLDNLELVFPLGVSFDRCQLPPRFIKGLSTPSLTLIECPGLKDLEGIRLLSTSDDVEPMEPFTPYLILEGMPDLEALCTDIPSLWNLTIRDCPLLQATHPVHVLDELVIEEMAWEELPDQLTIDSNLTLGDCPSLKLPRQILSTGDLTIKYLPSAHRWPEDFRCEGNLMIGGCPQLRIPPNVHFGGSLSLEHRSLSDPLLPGRVIDGCLDLNECTGDTLPNGIQVLGTLRLIGLQLHALPSDLQFESLMILNCPRLRLPEQLAVRGTFELMNGTLDTLEAGLSVAGPLIGIRGCKGTRLPEGLRVKGELLLYELPELEMLPDDLEAKVLRINFCPRLSIPASVEQRMKGRIHVH